MAKSKMFIDTYPLIILRKAGKIFIEKINDFKTLSNNGVPLGINEILELKESVDLVYENIKKNPISFQEAINLKTSYNQTIEDYRYSKTELSVLVYKLGLNQYKVVFTKDVTSFSYINNCLYEGLISKERVKIFKSKYINNIVSEYYVLDDNNFKCFLRDLKEEEEILKDNSN